MPTLEERVAALERQLGGDTLQSNILTVNSDGTIGADFTGTVDARGIIFPSSAAAGPGGRVQQNEIAWEDVNGTQICTIMGTATGALNLTANATADNASSSATLAAEDSNGNPVEIVASYDPTRSPAYEVTALAGPSSNGVTILNSAGNSDFVLAGLGAFAANVIGPSAAQSFGGVTDVAGAGGNITISNPAGARLLCFGNLSVYASAAGAYLYQYLYIDGTQIAQTRLHYFDQGSVHEQCGTWAYVTNVLAAGSHTVQLAAYDADALCYFNAGSTALIGAIELP